MKRNNLLSNVFMAAAFMSCGVAYAQNQQSARPNVLSFLDDITYNNGINALGNPELITPNLDRLVRNGTSFMNTYNMGGWHGALSVASRSQLLTGRYLWNAYEGEKEQFASVTAGREYLAPGDEASRLSNVYDREVACAG